jgi:hypothetical protein
MEQLDQTPEPPKKRYLPRLRISRKVFALILLLLVIVVGYLVYRDYKASKVEPVVVNDQCSNQRNSKMLQQIYIKLQKPDKQKLKSDVATIKKIPGYQKDATCLYPIITYQIARGDVTAANKTLTELKSAYNPSVGYSPYYGTDTKTPDELSSMVEVMLKQQKLNETQFDILSPKVKR